MAAQTKFLQPKACNAMSAPLLNPSGIGMAIGPVTAAVLAAILGAIFGSFIAALVSRWPQGRSVLAGRSRCDSCQATLAPWHLVPIASYLALCGRCARCRAPIGRDAIIIEAIAAAIGGLALALHPDVTGLSVALFGWLLLPLAWLDLQHYWLPHPLTAALAMGGVLTALVGLPPDWTSRVIGAVAGFGALWLVATGYRWLRGRDGLGGGDPLLFGAIGLWLGWPHLPLVLLAASGIGLGLALYVQRTHHGIDGTTRFPLGTLLAVAAWPIALIGPMFNAG
jgi:leader peptidase (prepilin peptidase)/N-methyltransferase